MANTRWLCFVRHNEFSMTVLNPLKADGLLSGSLELIAQNFKELLFFHLDGIYQQLDNRLLSLLLAVIEDNAENSQGSLSRPDLQKLALFSKGNRSLELTGPLLKALLLHPINKTALRSGKFDLVIDFALKKTPSAILVSRYQLDGKKHLQKKLKELTSELMDIQNGTKQ